LRDGFAGLRIARILTWGKSDRGTWRPGTRRGRQTGGGSVDESMWTGLGELSSGLADFYRDLHRHPELSLEEHRSAGRIAGALRPLGFEVTENVGGTRSE